jgi:dihydropteroate synthase
MSPFPVWSVRDKQLKIERPIVMGILNVTPDSFSDGGRFFSGDAASAQALRMLEEGADIIDVGGESTRPQSATPVPKEVELDRVMPVIERILRERRDAIVSVDTTKSAVAREALAIGAHIVNDVSGLRLDPRIASICAERRAGLVLMHSRGGVTDMATFAHAHYDDVAAEVVSELRPQINLAREAGIHPNQIVLDPGIGFAKKREHSLAVLAALPLLCSLGFPVLVGLSRKRFIGEITGVTEPTGRISGTLGANVAALALGARIFRVHDVRAAREALDVAWQILGGP